jgi:hypothetical protein
MKMDVVAWIEFIWLRIGTTMKCCFENSNEFSLCTNCWEVFENLKTGGY